MIKEIKKILINNKYMLLKVKSISKSYILFTFFISILTKISPVFTNLLIKYALEGQIVIFARISAFYLIFSFLVNFMESYYENIFSPIINENIQAEIYNEIFHKVIEIDIEKYDDTDFLNNYNYILQNSGSKAIETVQILIDIISSILSNN